MKKLLLALICTLLLLVASVKSVNAEEDLPTSSVPAEEVIENEEEIPTSPTEDEVIENEEIIETFPDVEETPEEIPTDEAIDNEEVNVETVPEIEPPVENVEEGSDLQIWFEKNLAWFIGLPTGGALTLLSFAIMTYKEKKEKRADIEETKAQNANADKLLKDVKNNLSEVKELANTLTNATTEALMKINITDKRVNDLVTNLTNKVTLSLDNVTKAMGVIEIKIANLEEVQEMIALHSAELVANGTAEKIAKVIRG